MSVEFENQDTLGGFSALSINGRGLPHVDSAQTRLALGISASLMIVATLFIWLKIGHPPRTFVDDSSLTPHSSSVTSSDL